MRVKRPRFLGFLLLAAGCASTPGASPHDMSAPQHEAVAADQERIAAAHGAQYDPDAGVEHEHCHSARAPDDACWTSIRNPTAEHLEEARKYRTMAADHRAASQALRDAEARACVGISEEDRDASPFTHREDIARVRPLIERSGPRSMPRTVGAVVTFVAVPGMSVAWVQRVVDCHLARNAALGHVVPEMPNCPLVPKGVSARVTAMPGGFEVAVRAESAFDQETAGEVLRRAQALKP
jgi:hypothetical protein